MIALTALFAAGGAIAQDGPNPVREACMPSIMTHCRDEAFARDRPAVRACLIKNFEKLSPDCQKAITTARAAAKASPKP